MATVAMLATIADSSASQKAGSVSSLVPSGVIFPFAGSTTPSGWIVCDGTAYNQADYPELFAALGSTYNTQVNPTTGSAWAAPSAGQFRVPDMRGLFLRGEGTASGGDAVSVGGHQVQKTAKNGLGANAALTNLSHSHGLTIRQRNPGGAGTVISEPQRGWSSQGVDDAAYTTGAASADMNHSHTITIAGDNETRPVNRGVRYIIKV